MSDTPMPPIIDAPLNPYPVSDLTEWELKRIQMAAKMKRSDPMLDGARLLLDGKLIPAATTEIAARYIAQSKIQSLPHYAAIILCRTAENGSPSAIIAADAMVLTLQKQLIRQANQGCLSIFLMLIPGYYANIGGDTAEIQSICSMYLKTLSELKSSRGAYFAAILLSTSYKSVHSEALAALPELLEIAGRTHNLPDVDKIRITKLVWYVTVPDNIKIAALSATRAFQSASATEILRKTDRSKLSSEVVAELDSTLLALAG